VRGMRSSVFDPSRRPATVTHRRAPALIPPAELARITCDVRAGDGLDHETAVRLLEHLEIVSGVLRAQAQRAAEAGVVHAEVHSRVPDDPASVGRRA